jgi:transcriptional regulator with XRE-family HTH domain
MNYCSPYGAVDIITIRHESRCRGCSMSSRLAALAKDHITDDAGQRLKRARERLNLRYRDVEEASLRIAARHKNDEFAIALSRLADIENKGTVPSVYRLYSLCAIYRLDISEVLNWYGIDLGGIAQDAGVVEIERTHTVSFDADGHSEVLLPLSLDPGLDVRRTTFLSRMIQRWGKLPLMLLGGFDLKGHRYGYIGTEDWRMYPILQPGSLILIDETRRKPASGGWTNEFDRPIYFFEHRQGYACSWCTLTGDQLVLQPHPGSQCAPEIFEYPSEIEVVGQVAGVAMRLDPARRRRTRS